MSKQEDMYKQKSTLHLNSCTCRDHLVVVKHLFVSSSLKVDGLILGNEATAD